MTTRRKLLVGLGAAPLFGAALAWAENSGKRGLSLFGDALTPPPGSP